MIAKLEHDTKWCITKQWQTQTTTNIVSKNKDRITTFRTDNSRSHHRIWINCVCQTFALELLNRKEVSMIKKYHNYTLQTNSLHREEEPQNTYSQKTQGRHLKQPTISLCDKLIAKVESKKDGKDQERIQSSTTPDPGYHMGK